MSEKNSIGQDLPSKEDRIEIEFYTDPLCCWSWAMEPQWRRLKFEYRNNLVWKYRMGCLITNWNNYNDSVNSITRPVQMGPLWMDARNISGMPIQDRIWYEDPPSSSYLPCLAVKTAELQSPLAAEVYLRATREAVMLKGQSISKMEILLNVAKEVSESIPQIFCAHQFEQDLKSNFAHAAFNEDLLQVRINLIARYPTIIIRKAIDRGVAVVGFRPYEDLRAALLKVSPNLMPSPGNWEDYKGYLGTITNRELKEFSELSMASQYS